MEPEKILDKLLLGLGEDIGSTLGLNKTQKSLLNKAFNGIFEYAKFKVDPHGHKALTSKVNQAIIGSKIALIENALQKHNELILEKLETVDSSELALYELNKLINSPTIESFISLVVDASKESALISTPKKKKAKSHYYEGASWWHRFCEHLDKKYEDWRHDLFARALFLEQQNEGSISYSTLWQIAMLPPEQWEELEQYRSLAAELFVDGEFYGFVIPGTYSVRSAIDFSYCSERRFLNDLISSMEHDRHIDDTGVIGLPKEAEILIKYGNKQKVMYLSDEYEDPQFDEVEGTPLQNQVRFFCSKLSRIGEELLDLATDVSPNPDSVRIIELGLDNLGEEGVYFKDK
ncbi:MAG: hypothetical protein ABJK37_01370 [Paraglaciecola sp.]|uniref:hypothetical protein n=1 Tax=Paraglaciecola sp. TaxID=1920173 RepID=UPI003298E962